MPIIRLRRLGSRTGLTILPPNRGDSRAKSACQDHRSRADRGPRGHKLGELTGSRPVSTNPAQRADTQRPRSRWIQSGSRQIHAHARANPAASAEPAQHLARIAGGCESGQSTHRFRHARCSALWTVPNRSALWTFASGSATLPRRPAGRHVHRSRAALCRGANPRSCRQRRCAHQRRACGNR